MEIIKKISEWFKNLFYVQEEIKEEEKKIYVQRPFMTEYEYEFYLKLKDLEREYTIIPQINLATIIKKTNNGYINELFKNIDFAIFDKDLKKVLLLIEVKENINK